jgi:uncharacterized RDD family membrane protein YckC
VSPSPKRSPTASDTAPSLEVALRKAERASLLRRFLGDWLLEAVLILVTAGVGWLIWLFFAAKKGQSPAKRLVNTYIVDANTRMPVTADQVWLREVLVKWLYLPVLSWVPPGLAIIICGWALFNKKRQTLYDRLLGTQVVYAPGVRWVKEEHSPGSSVPRGIDRLGSEIGQAD